MSKRDKSIKLLISYIMKNKEPIFINRYSWSNIDSQKAAVWLSRKKIVKLEKYGEFYRITRRKFFYDIYDEIKEKTVNQIFNYLKKRMS